MSRLGLGLGLSKGRAFSPFDPLSLNPILAFEASRSMMAPLASESLDLDPANPSTLDIITTTRAGTATYTDSSGNIQTASPNTVRVDHPQGEELTPTVFQRVGYTDFSQGWFEYSNGTSASDGGGYNGNPSKAVEALSTYGSYGYLVPTQDGVTYCLSLYIKRLSGSGNIRLTAYSASGTTTFDITSSLSSEFTRVSAVFQGKSGGGDVRVGIQDYGSGDMEVEIAMPQVEEGTTASDFVENTTGSPKLIAAATYAPRVPMMLIEPAATNLISYTDFSSGWVQGGLTISDGEGLSGQVSKVVENDDAGSGNTFYFNVPTVEGQTYTGGFWIRRISGTGLLALHHTFSPTGSQVTITNDVTSEWTFVSTQFLGRTGGGSVRFGVRVYYTSGDSVEIAMPQVEAGSVATSFIPTSGSAVTRAADNLVIDGSDFTNFYNQSEGTIYIETVGRELDFNYIFAISDGSSNRILAIHHAFNHLYVQTSGVLQGAPDAGTFTAGTLCRYAASFKENDLSVVIDGGNVGTDTSATIPTVNKINIGSRENGNEHLNGHIKRLIYWPHHSDNL